MSESEYGIHHERHTTVEFRNFLGYVLILCGVAIVFWVVINIYGLFTNPAKLTPFQELVSKSIKTLSRG